MYNRSFYFLLGIIYLISGCDLETTKINDPVFKKHVNEIMDFKLKNIILPGEQIKYNGYQLSSGANTTSELDINIINAERLPQDKDELRSISSKIATAFKLSLVNKKQYQTYKVTYVTKPNEFNGETTTMFTTIKANELPDELFL